MSTAKEHQSSSNDRACILWPPQFDAEALCEVKPYFYCTPMPPQWATMYPDIYEILRQHGPADFLGMPDRSLKIMVSIAYFEGLLSQTQVKSFWSPFYLIHLVSCILCLL